MVRKMGEEEREMRTEGRSRPWMGSGSRESAWPEGEGDRDRVSFVSGAFLMRDDLCVAVPVKVGATPSENAAVDRTEPSTHPAGAEILAPFRRQR